MRNLKAPGTLQALLTRKPPDGAGLRPATQSLDRPWYVRFALRFPHTFYVLASLIVFLGVTAIRAMPTDISADRHSGRDRHLEYTACRRRRWSSASHLRQYSISSNVTGIKTWVQRSMHLVQKIYFQPT